MLYFLLVTWILDMLGTRETTYAGFFVANQRSNCRELQYKHLLDCVHPILKHYYWGNIEWTIFLKMRKNWKCTEVSIFYALIKGCIQYYSAIKWINLLHLLFNPFAYCILAIPFIRFCLYICTCNTFLSILDFILLILDYIPKT